MPPHKSLNESVIEEVCKILAYHDGGQLTHAQITEELRKHNLADQYGSGQNKQNRLKAALLQAQRSNGCSNHVLAFIQGVVNPVRFVGRKEVYENFTSELNRVLVFDSLKIQQDGKLVFVTAAKTLDEAEDRASRLRKRLNDRAVHPDVVKCCHKELIVDNNYFHTVLEAAKSVAKKNQRKNKSRRRRS